MRILNKKVIVGLSLIAILWVAWSRLGGPANQPGQGKAVPVITAKVTAEPYTETVRAVGTLLADEAAIIRPEVPGVITAIHFREGERVETGQPLVDIDASAYKAELGRAKAALDLALLTFRRRSELRRTGAASVQVSDEAQAALREAQATYELARMRMDKAGLKAPFSGRIGLRHVSAGDYVNVAQEITEIMDSDPMKVEFAVPEKFASALAPGQKLTAAVDAYPGRAFEGVVFAVDARVDPDTRNISAKAEIANPDDELKPGMFAYVTIALANRTGAMFIPEEAVIPKGSEKFVMKVVNGKAQLVPVKLGARRDAKVEVIEGLAEGDEIITAGHIKVQPDMPVQPMVPEGVTGQEKKE